jgi:hypothetical protein
MKMSLDRVHSPVYTPGIQRSVRIELSCQNPDTDARSQHDRQPCTLQNISCLQLQDNISVYRVLMYLCL